MVAKPIHGEWEKPKNLTRFKRFGHIPLPSRPTGVGAPRYNRTQSPGNTFRVPYLANVVDARTPFVTLSLEYMGKAPWRTKALQYRCVLSFLGLKGSCGQTSHTQPDNDGIVVFCGLWIFFCRIGPCRLGFITWVRKKRKSISDRGIVSTSVRPAFKFSVGQNPNGIYLANDPGTPFLDPITFGFQFPF